MGIWSGHGQVGVGCASETMNVGSKCRWNGERGERGERSELRSCVVRVRVSLCGAHVGPVRTGSGTASSSTGYRVTILRTFTPKTYLISRSFLPRGAPRRPATFSN